MKIELGWLSVSLLKKKSLVRSQLFSIIKLIKRFILIGFYFYTLCNRLKSEELSLQMVL